VLLYVVPSSCWLCHHYQQSTYFFFVVLLQCLDVVASLLKVADASSAMEHGAKEAERQKALQGEAQSLLQQVREQRLLFSLTLLCWLYIDWRHKPLKLITLKESRFDNIKLQR
jgi:hypothetical protein